MKKTFKEFLAEREQEKVPGVVIVHMPSVLLEYETYKEIPGTKNSYRQDSANTNTKTQQHVHVYAKPKGEGKEVYAVNKDGSGHDGHSGKEIPKSHAEYFRGKGYDIKANNILECLTIEDIGGLTFFIIVESA
jgi:hypothetical protein